MRTIRREKRKGAWNERRYHPGAASRITAHSTPLPFTWRGFFVSHKVYRCIAPSKMIHRYTLPHIRMRVRYKVYRSVSGADTPPGKVFDDISSDTAKFIITGQYIIVFLLLCSKKYEAVSICMSGLHVQKSAGRTPASSSWWTPSRFCYVYRNPLGSRGGVRRRVRGADSPPCTEIRWVKVRLKLPIASQVRVTPPIGHREKLGVLLGVSNFQ